MNRMIHTELQRAVQFPVPCPSCGKETTQTVRWLMTHPKSICHVCNGRIDLATEHWHSIINNFLATITDLQLLYGDAGHRV